VGDYVNRGPDSFRVIDLLIRAKIGAPNRFVFLMGNHELALLKFLKGGQFIEFASIGGVPTIRSYVGHDVVGDVRHVLERSIPEDHLTFLESLITYWESDRLLVSHAGYDPQEPCDRGLMSMVANGHPAIFNEKCPLLELTVCGHYLQKSGKPYSNGHLICVDTGCGTVGGPLTAVLLPEREFISV
jgi:serine/threonine protein phosphatase 1